MNFYKETWRDHLGNLLKMKSLLTLIVVGTITKPPVVAVVAPPLKKGTKTKPKDLKNYS